MVALAESVDHVECAHALEAGVRELRLLAAHAPPYNRRSQVSAPLVVGGAHRRGVPPAVGGARTAARQRSRARSASAPTPSRRPFCWPGSPECAPAPPGWRGRRCTGRPARQREVSPCPAARGVSAARLRTGGPARAAELIAGADNAALAAAVDQVRALAERGRYESAARLRDHAAVAVEMLWRGQRLHALADGRRIGGGPARTAPAAGTWRWSGTASWPRRATPRRGVPPMPVVDALCSRRADHPATPTPRWAVRWSRRPR